MSSPENGRDGASLAQRSEASRDDAADRHAADADVDLPDLSLFRIEILYALANSGPEYGLAIKRALEERYGEDVNHGRLYPNLDTLEELGLIEKSKRDDRTNEYELTEAGQFFVRDHARQRLEGADAADDRFNGGSA